jgi:hypothetical protein
MVAWWGMQTRTIWEILKDHVQLEVECVDRLYLNGYVPSLQSGGGISYFFGTHRGQPVVSPALMEQMRKDWMRRVEQWMEQEGVPLVAFEKGERKDDVAQRAARPMARRRGRGFRGHGAGEGVGLRRRQARLGARRSEL